MSTHVRSSKSDIGHTSTSGLDSVCVFLVPLSINKMNCDKTKKMVHNPQTARPKENHWSDDQVKDNYQAPAHL